MEPTVVRQLVTRIFDLLGLKLGARGADLEARYKQVKRKLPGGVRKSVEVMIRADKLAKSPQLAMQIDPGATTAAYSRALKHLDKIDPTAYKSKARFGLAATIAGQVLFVLVAFLLVMWWRGYV